MISLLVVNLVRLTKLVLPGMVQRGHGHLLQVASAAAFQPVPLYATYAAAKSFVLSFSMALNRELAGTGVTSSALCPGITITEFQQVAGQRPNWFIRLSGMSPDRVAAVGVRKMLKGRPLIVPGFMNRVAGALTKLTPRGIAARVAHILMRTE